LAVTLLLPGRCPSRGEPPAPSLSSIRILHLHHRGLDPGKQEGSGEFLPSTGRTGAILLPGKGIAREKKFPATLFPPARSPANRLEALARQRDGAILCRARICGKEDGQPPRIAPREQGGEIAARRRAPGASGQEARMEGLPQPVRARPGVAGAFWESRFPRMGMPLPSCFPLRSPIG